MAMNLLPEGAELRLAGVRLPPGRRVYAEYGSGGPVAWATTQPVPDPGRVWAALSEACQATGLVPFLLSSMTGYTRRPWDEGEFNDPADTSALDDLDAATVLQSAWNHFVPPEEEDDEGWRAGRAPFSRTFPGLAPPEDTSLGRQQLDEILGSLTPARIGLVAAGRPADVLPRIGWPGAADWDPMALQVAAVLRSWEDRFGARLLRLGFDEIQLLAERPPRTIRAAQLLAAEHCAFCDSAGNGLNEVHRVAEYLLNTPIWTFWWD
jgi:Domain of unknown function (DUF4253)